VFVHVPGPELLEPAQQWLTTLCMAFHSRLMQVATPMECDASQLSGREHEVLRWMAQGKSAEDVAEIIGISVATVMFHYRNVAVRYGTLNRTHTVVEALRRGSLAIG
jgi:DNA-binding CsgD family transcriptional regulator